jgi:uncharacterized protein YlzI (FlbEa/FlbD family)
MKGAPIILHSATDAGQVLGRVESRTKDEKTEEWLQDLIFDHPEILPVEEFDEAFSPLIPIGREVGTRSGSIDNLYISPLGRLTIVETKLWKNPEKHRTVVAQIIDYAKEVSKWDYKQLSEAVLKASRAKGTNERKSLDQIAAPLLDISGISLTDFQERTITNLRGGEFLLLIIGDRISANVALLTESIRGVPGLDFRLGLIELQLFPLGKDADWPILVVPDVVGRTTEVTRGVIKIQYVQEKPSVTAEISEEESPGAPKGKTTPEVFLQKAPTDLRPVYEQWLEMWTSKRMYIYWGTVGFSVKVPIEGKYQTVFDAYPEWAVSLIRELDAEKVGATAIQYQAYYDQLTAVPDALSTLAAGKKYILHENITAEDLMIIFKAATEFVESIRIDNDNSQS